MQKAVVIGAGLGGLAIAARLVARGWQVTVCERNGQPGGRAQYEVRDGYVFDRGPSVLTGPWMLDAIWALFNERRRDDLKLLPVDPSYHFIFPDGHDFYLSRDPVFMRKEVERVAPSNLEGWERYRQHVIGFWEGTVRSVMKTPMLNLCDLLRFTPGMVAGGGFLSMNALVERYLEDPYLIRALRFHPTFVGASCWAPGSAIYSAMQGLEWEEGVSFPAGGMNALVKALEDLAARHGVEFRYNCEVKQLKLDRHKVTGVELANGEMLSSDVVISNADAAFTYEKLVPEYAQRFCTSRYFDNASYSTGLFVWYFGTKTQYPEVSHHSVIFGDDVPGGWQCEGPVRFDTFTYLHRPTASDPSLAPPGCDTFYALRAVPNLSGIVDWQTEADDQRRILMNLLDGGVLPGLRDNIAVDWWATPRLFRTDLQTLYGAGFGLAPTLFQSALFRPHPKSDAIKGLYLVGEGTHPGPGIPAVLSSAEIVDALLNPGVSK
ncbi:MAG: phytoene desaturase [Myxococcales bacterium]|nr:phytoene desaturase [Myxococcales bacterium]